MQRLKGNEHHVTNYLILSFPTYEGLYPVPKGASPIIGVEVSGYIHALGPNCSDRFKVGDACMALLQGGGYAQYAVAYGM